MGKLSHDTDNVAVLYILFIDAVIAKHDIIMLSYSNHSMQDIAVRRAAIKYHIILPAPLSGFLFYSKGITSLFEHRKHTGSCVPISQCAIKL